MPRVTITVPDRNAQPYRFQLDREVVTLGRGSENDIAIDSGSVSVQHAEMRRIPGGYELHDVGSTNGIKLNGDRLDIIPLRSGMTAHIGDVAFDFSLSEEEHEVLASERAGDPTSGARETEVPPLKPVRKREEVIIVPASSGGLGAILLFLILAAAAFFAGLAVRYQKETNGNLIEAIRTHASAQNTPASAPETPAAPETQDPAETPEP